VATVPVFVAGMYVVASCRQYLCDIKRIVKHRILAYVLRVYSDSGLDQRHQCPLYMFRPSRGCVLSYAEIMCRAGRN